MPEFPVGYAALWRLHCDDSRMLNKIRRIDLLLVEPASSEDPLDVYRNIFALVPRRRVFRHDGRPFLEHWRRVLHGRQASIFEAEGPNTYSALGQVLSYTELFREDFPETPVVEKALVSDAVDALLAETLRRHNVAAYSTAGRNLT